MPDFMHGELHALHLTPSITFRSIRHALLEILDAAHSLVSLHDLHHFAHTVQMLITGSQSIGDIRHGDRENYKEGEDDAATNSTITSVCVVCCLYCVLQQGWLMTDRRASTFLAFLWSRVFVFITKTELRTGARIEMGVSRAREGRLMCLDMQRPDLDHLRVSLVSTTRRVVHSFPSSSTHGVRATFFCCCSCWRK